MTRLPSLGPRGEGWVVIQVALLGVTAAAGWWLGNAWDDGARVVSTVIGLGALATGGTLAILGLHDLGDALTPLPHPRDRAVLVETGVYRLVRHPIYGGLVLGAVGWSSLTASPAAFVLSGVLCVFLILKSAREEAWLLARFPGYASYRTRTDRFIPWIG